MSEFLLKSHKSIKTKHSSGHDDVGGGEEHGEAGDDGEQRVHDQTQPVNHHRSELPVSLHRRGLVFLLHLRRSVIIETIGWFSIFMANFKDTQNTSNLCSRYHQSYILMQVNLLLCIDSPSLLSNFLSSSGPGPGRVKVR